MIALKAMVLMMSAQTTLALALAYVCTETS
jgi:hypothetical protein